MCVYQQKKIHEKRVHVAKVRIFLLTRGFVSLFWLESQWSNALIHDRPVKNSYLFEK
jgi:hypothetical protein